MLRKYAGVLEDEEAHCTEKEQLQIDGGSVSAETADMFLAESRWAGTQHQQILALEASASNEDATLDDHMTRLVLVSTIGSPAVGATSGSERG